jgi:hypothetical protein
MLRISNCSVYGLVESVLASGYPFRKDLPCSISDENDSHLIRAKKLGRATSGSGHDTFLKGIIVQFDLTYPLYIDKQLKRYHFIDTISSQSTMHCILEMDIEKQCNEYVFPETILELNWYINQYNHFKNNPETFKKIFMDDDYNEWLYEQYMTIISNVPSGFELTARVTTNYLQLKTIYNQRKNHKLKEDWGYFCNWILELPMFEELCIKEEVEI